jgi:hypothetical protein
MIDVNVQNDVRYLTLAELDEVAGGFTLPSLGLSSISTSSNANIAGQNVGVGEISLGGSGLFNIGIGIGELNVHL